MKLVFAQGNPGERFAHTRHNAGFVAIDAHISKLGLNWTEKTKFSAFVAEQVTPHGKVLFVKPTTFYNETGVSARSIVDYYDIEPSEDVLVLHDELAMPFGTIRTRLSGSDAGNNGIKSLNASLGDSYARIRIGIWNELLPTVGSTDFVIGRFNKEESEQLPKIAATCGDLIDAFLNGRFEAETLKLEE